MSKQNNSMKILFPCPFLYLYQESFYKSRIDKGIINKNDLGLYVFASKPSSGAAIFKF